MSKPKQPSFNKGNASAGKMNERELVQRNPATAFGQGYTAPAQSGGSSTSNPIPKVAPKKVTYKGRTITAQSDIARVQQNNNVPATLKPKVKKVNKRND